MKEKAYGVFEKCRCGKEHLCLTNYDEGMALVFLTKDEAEREAGPSQIVKKIEIISK